MTASRLNLKSGLATVFHLATITTMSIANDQKLLIFGLIYIFAILGAILLAISLFDNSTTDDKTAMGCFGISFTALSIILMGVLIY